MSTTKKNIMYTFSKKKIDENLAIQKKNNFFYTKPELYLELLENKEKVKKEVLNIPFKTQETSLEILEKDFEIENSLFDQNFDNVEKKMIEKTDNFVNLDKIDKIDKIEEIDDQEYEPIYQSIKNTKHPILNLKRKLHSFSYSPKKYKINIDYDEKIRELEEKNNPPPLSSFIPGYHNKDVEEEFEEFDELQAKQNIIAKLNMLRHLNPDETIPYITMNDDYKYMKNEYDILVKNLKIYDKHSNYKQILTLGFFGIEFIFGKFLKLKMNGFANAQLNNFSKYDKLLLELGEKNYLPDAPERFPVEVRLVGVVIIQAAIFAFMNQFTNGSENGNIFDFVTSFMSKKSEKSEKNKTKTKEETKSKQSKMKGPKITK